MHHVLINFHIRLLKIFHGSERLLCVYLYFTCIYIYYNPVEGVPLELCKRKFFSVSRWFRDRFPE